MKDADADLNQSRWIANDELAEGGLPRVDCIGTFRHRLWVVDED
jgi:hypothetical protein